MAADSPYSVGQVWTFADAPRPEARVIIGAVDEVKSLGSVLSISVTGMPVTNPANGEIQIFGIDHAPMTPDALGMSLIEHVGTSEPPPNFEALRANWQNLMSTDGAGVFTISVAELVGLYQALIQKSIASEQQPDA